MTLTGNAHRLDVLASRLPVSLQRWLGASFLLFGLGLLAVIDVVYLPRILAFHRAKVPAFVTQAPLPSVAPQKTMAMIHPLSPSQPSTAKPEVNAAPDLPPLTFQKSMISLSPASQETLAKALAFLEENPSARVVLSGHTDHQGTAYINNSLSLERAQQAQDWLVLHGIDSSRVHTQGFGSTEPLIRSRSLQAQARNRRVEISFR